MDAEASRRPTPPGPAAESSYAKGVAPEAGSRRYPGNGHGVGQNDPDDGAGNPATAAAKHAAHYLNELKTYATYFLSAKVDGYKATAKRIAILAGLGVVGLFVTIGILFSAAFLLLAGLANALGALLGGHVWAGQLIVGFLILAGVGVGALIVLKKVTAASKKQTELKYASKRNEQRVEFGHDVHDRARAAGARH